MVAELAAALRAAALAAERWRATSCTTSAAVFCRAPSSMGRREGAETSSADRAAWSAASDGATLMTPRRASASMAAAATASGMAETKTTEGASARDASSSAAVRPCCTVEAEVLVLASSIGTSSSWQPGQSCLTPDANPEVTRRSVAADSGPCSEARRTPAPGESGRPSPSASRPATARRVEPVFGVSPGSSTGRPARARATDAATAPATKLG
mmetsp:Transcript_2994/g.12279  ORF Transcript_2994/g.12279 Transcript_2994/m.12279 type:complete len:213 (-) Transcript_2994:2252-2890(-)